MSSLVFAEPLPQHSSKLQILFSLYFISRTRPYANSIQHSARGRKILIESLIVSVRETSNLNLLLYQPVKSSPMNILISQIDFSKLGLFVRVMSHSIKLVVSIPLLLSLGRRLVLLGD